METIQAPTKLIYWIGDCTECGAILKAGRSELFYTEACLPVYSAQLAMPKAMFAHCPHCASTVQFNRQVVV